MNCTNFKEGLGSFLDNEINQACKVRFEIHLHECQLCRLNFEELRSIKRALKTNLPVSPSEQFDDRVMKAFSERQKQISINKSLGWRSIFVPFFMHRVSWAFTAVIFVVGLSAAFQIGKLAATDITVNLATTEAISLPPSEIKEENLPSTTITRIVEVPVVKEKVITRVVYVKRDKQNGVQAKRINTKLLDNVALNNSFAENGYLTQTNLKGFQPPSEITTTVIKGEGKDEK